MAPSKPIKPKFPFLFYGADPAEWGDTADAVQLYEMRFAKAPDQATRLRIGRSFEEALSDSSVRTDPKPWLWAGEWALVPVQRSNGETDDEDDDAPYHDDFALADEADDDGADDDDDDLDDDDEQDDPHSFIEDMTYALRQIHSVAALAEVVFCGAREATPSDPWEKWTVAAQAERTPGPKWGGWAKLQNLDVGPFASPDRVAVTSAEDARFEAERKKVRKVAAGDEDDELETDEELEDDEDDDDHDDTDKGDVEVEG